MAFIPGRKKAAAARDTAAPTGTATAPSQPEYFDTLDPETRTMMLDAKQFSADAAGKPVHETLVRNPFKFGFIITLGGLAAIVLGTAVSQLATILVYIVAAMFIALGLDPVVRWLERHGMKRSLAITTVFLSFALLIAGVLAWIIPAAVRQIANLIQVAPQYVENLPEQPWFISINNVIGGVVNLDALTQSLYDFVSKPDNWATLFGGILQAGVGVANGITATIIIFILSLYFLASLQTIKRSFYRLAPRTNRFAVIDITEQVTRSIGGYISGMVTLAALSAILGFIVMTIVGAPFAGALALVIFTFGLIPLIGPLLGNTIATIVVLFFGSPSTALILGIYFLIYMQIEAYFFTPRVMNRAVSVPGSLVVIGAMAGGTLLGLLGALIAIPVTAMILIIIKQVWMPAQDNR